MLPMGRLNRATEARSSVTIVGTMTVRLESIFTGQGTSPLPRPATAAVWHHSLSPTPCNTGDPGTLDSQLSNHSQPTPSTSSMSFEKSTTRTSQSRSTAWSR
jgi:hypothetical protein